MAILKPFLYNAKSNYEIRKKIISLCVPKIQANECIFRERKKQQKNYFKGIKNMSTNNSLIWVNSQKSLPSSNKVTLTHTENWYVS